MINEHQLDPHRIFNCDESGLISVNKSMKVIAQGKRVVLSVTTAERGQTAT